MKQYIVALDQGTTSSRCIIFDKGQHVIGMAQKEYTPVSYTHLDVYKRQGPERVWQKDARTKGKTTT